VTPRVAVVYPVPVPYSFPFLRRVAESGAIDLTVLYARASLTGRGVAPSLADVGFPHRVLRDSGRVFVGREIREIDFSPTLPLELERGRIDLVVVSGFVQPTALSGVGWALARGRRYGVLSESHDLRRRSAAKRALRRAAVGPVVRRASVLYPTGELAARALAAFGVDERKLVQLPHVPDPTLFRADRGPDVRTNVRRELGIPDDVPVVAYVGRLIESKGVATLLRAHERVSRESGAFLAVVGTGPLDAELRREARAGVAFLGFRPPTEVASLLAASDVSVVPSFDEPWGTVLLEALASGCPVVASDRVGAAGETVGRFCAGRIFPAGDAERLAEGVLSVLREPELRERAVRAAAGYTPEAAAAAFLRGVEVAFS